MEKAKIHHEKAEKHMEKIKHEKMEHKKAEHKKHKK